MTLTATFRTSHHTTGTPHGTGTTVTPTFDIPNTARVVMFVCIMDDGSVSGDQTPGTPTITNTAGLTFTEIGGQENTSSYRQRLSAHISDASGSSQTGRTITLDEPANINVYSYTVLVWTVVGDFDTGDLTDGFISIADTADGAETLTLTEAPATGDLVFYGQGTDSVNAPNPTYSGATWDTNRTDGDTTVAHWIAGNYRTANTSTSVVITDVYTGAGSFFKNTAAAFILRDNAAGITGTSAQTLDAFTSTASGSVNSPPGVVYVKEVGFVTDTTAAGTSTITTAGTTVPIGDYLVIYGACDNTGSGGIATTIAVADNSAQSGSANVYTLQTPQAIADPVGASAGIQGFFVVCPVTRSIPASTTITVTYGNSTAAKAINVQQFTPSISGTISVLASSYARQDNQTGQSVSVAAGAAPTMANQIVCAFAAVEGGTADAFTQDTDTTNGAWVGLTRRGSGTTTSGATLNSVYKVTTAGGAQTYDHATMLGTARDHCAAILVLTPPPISGTVAATLSAFTSTASGSVDTTTTGTVAVTLAPFTSTASGTETLTGTSATTLAPFTSTAAGTVAPPVTGTVAVTLAAFTSTATGAETFTGTSAATLAPFTSTAAGTETLTGTSATTLAPFTSTASGTVTGIVTGTSAQTLAPFTSTAAAVTGTGAIYVGEVLGATSTTTETFWDVTASQTLHVPAGDTVVMYGACDNTGSGGAATVVDFLDAAGNTYTLQTPQAIADPGTTSEGVQGFFLVSTLTDAWHSGGGAVISFANTTAAKAVSVQRFAGVAAVLPSSYARQDNQTGQSVSVAAGAAPTAAGQAVCALAAVEGDTGDAFTQDTDTTNGAWQTLTRRGAGSGTSGITLNSAYKLTTAGGAQTYDHATMLGTARDHCAAILVLEGIAGTVTGTVAATLAAFTSTASGAETFTGTSAQTLAPFTSTAAGTVANPVTGTSATTLAPFTSTASGIETITGTSAQTLAPFTSTASGSSFTGVSGTVAATLAAFTSTATGTVTNNVTGTSAQTLAPFTSTAAGIETITGTVAVTLAPFTSTATGTETLTGTSATTLAPFTSTATGTATVFVTGTAAPVLAPFTSAAAATLTITGTVGVTLGEFIGYGIEEIFVSVDGPRIRSHSPGRITSTSQARIRSRDTGLITSGV